MRIAKSNHFKTNPHNPTGLATCDMCGLDCNGGNLRKYITYVGSPMPDYSTPQKYMQSGDPMGSGQLQWNGLMVCPRCLDKPNPQSAYKAPLGDPFRSDGDRPMRSLTSYGNYVLSTETTGKILFLEDGSEPIAE